MAAKFLAASGAFATSGDNVRVKSCILTALGGVGSVTFKTGGAGGTATSHVITLLENTSRQFNLLPYHIIADYATLANASIHIEFE